MIPQLPTDNLYKFTTLGGIAILVFCMWSLHENSMLMDKGTTSFNQVVNNFDAISDDFGGDITILETQVANLHNLVKEATKPESANNAFKAQTAIDAYKQTVAATEMATKKLFELRKARSNADTQGSDLKMLLDRISYDLNQISWLLKFGGVITVWGMLSWYFKHQRYQDELLRVQLDDARRTLSKPAMNASSDPHSEDHAEGQPTCDSTN